ncbi:MAG: hypothetical protein IJ010_03185 [Ruminococcus sp.]|nr:hypothetical protein [Ruminococcus sp.]
MDILLVTSSFNDEIHGSDDKKKTGCGISLIKPENISKYRITSVMTDLKEITCEKCKERLAKKIIRLDKKEMAKILKEERAKAKKGIEDEGIIPLGNTTAKITKSPEQKRQEEESAAEAARREAEAKRAAEEAAREAEEAARKAAEEEAARAVQKTIPGTGIAMDNSLAQFAINVPKEEEPEPQPVQDDFLAQFAIQKPEEETPAEDEIPAVQDDFLAQFAIPVQENNVQPDYLSDESTDSSYDYESSSAAYENDDSVINVSDDELISISEETAPAEQPETILTGNSDWDFVANQIFGFEGVNTSEPEPQPAEMEELPLPSQTAAPETARTPEPKPAVSALDDITPPVLEDIAPPVLEDISPRPIENVTAPVLEEITAPVLDEMIIPEVPVLSGLSSVKNEETVQPAAVEEASSIIEEAAPVDEFDGFEIPEVPVLNNISAIAEQPEAAAEEAAETFEEETEEIIEEEIAETIEEAVEETAEEAIEEEIPEAIEEPVQAAPPVQQAPVQTAPPVQQAPVQSAPPVQQVPVQTAPPVQQAPVQTAPPVQPQVISVPQISGYDQNGQPVYTYVQMQMTGYDQNGQPIYNPIGGQQLPIPPQAPQRRPMMGMSSTMGGQMGANIQKPFVQLDAPTQTPAYIKAKLGSQGTDGQYMQPSANISKIAVNPHSKETSKAFVNAISSSKDYANKNLIETQGLRANSPILSSVEDVLSQMGDNSLKNQKKAEQAEVKLGSEYKAPAARPSAPRPAPKKQEEDIRFMTKSELKEKKKQDKYAAKFKKDLAKRGF